MKKLTIIDIAKAAGVGKSTVSRVINGDSGVKETTKEKVLKVIKELNFTPSISAQNMRLKQKKVIGVINTRIDSKSENKAIRGILNTIYEKEYDVIILESLFSEEKTKEHVEVLRDKGVSGIIIFVSTDVDYSFLKKLDIPVVMIAQEVKGFVSVVYDDYNAIWDVLTFLESKGVQRIGYIGVGLEDNSTGRLRHEAYFDWCKGKKAEVIDEVGDFSYESGYRLCKRIIDEHKEVEAIVCATDNIALGARKYLQEINKEITITGVGNEKLLRFLYEGHISINFDYEKSGEIAGKDILKLILKEDVTSSKIRGKLVY